MASKLRALLAVLWFYGLYCSHTHTQNVVCVLRIYRKCRLWGLPLVLQERRERERESTEMALILAFAPYEMLSIRIIWVAFAAQPSKREL